MRLFSILLLHRCAPISRAHSPRRSRVEAFTIVEAVIALAALIIVMAGTTVTLNLFNDRSARNRNGEAARALVENYVDQLLADGTAVPAPTAAGSDLDGDGVTDGVVCTAIGSVAVPASIPLIVSRNSTATPVVTGVLYWRVQNVGLAYGLNADTDLVQVNFLFRYVYRNQTYYYKVGTFKAAS